MAEVTFGITDAETLKEAAEILDRVARQILEAHAAMPTRAAYGSAYAAFKHTHEVALTLKNWSTVLESKTLDAVVQGKMRLGENRSHE